MTKHRSNESHEKLRDATFELLRLFQEQTRRFKRHLLNNRRKEARAGEFITDNALIKEARELRDLSSKLEKAMEKLMDQLKLEHSDAFVSEDMKRFLRICEQLAPAIPRLLDETPRPLKNTIKDMQWLGQTLTKSIEQIKEQQLAEKSKSLRWSMY
jgi:hypothetical protein